MLDAFKAFIAAEKLPVHEPVLLAVSGGMDSVAMTELFYRAQYAFGIAHCNFNLRGRESDGDEQFVEALARRYNVPYFSRSFDTEKYAADKGISTQTAARDLRYAWFSALLEKAHFATAATAHHRDDEMETVLINLVRGTGLAGLHGIPVMNNKVIRPLLFATRKEIEQFVQDNGLAYREDSSNSCSKYVRNKIRHEVIPVLRGINPNLEQAFSRTVEHIRDAESIYQAAIREKADELFTRAPQRILIDIAGLKKLHPLRTYLFEFLKPYGFNRAVVNEITASLCNEPGRQFFSPTHLLVRDRKYLIIAEIRETEKRSVEILKDTSSVEYPVPLKFKVTERDQSFEIPTSKNTACLNYELLNFPLILRPWEAGDAFMPLGMKQLKKLSDFFIDKKLSRIDKQRVYVLVSGTDIVWVVGHRIDERFKVGPHTSMLYICRLANP